MSLFAILLESSSLAESSEHQRSKKKEAKKKKELQGHKSCDEKFFPWLNY